MHFVYRHIRLDKNEPFYIGVGKVEKGVSLKCRYHRAYAKVGRNNHWKNVVGTTNIEVDIIYEHEDREVIQAKEREFISLYGRVDLGTGTLVNLTEGGDWNYTHSAETIVKLLNTARKNGSYERTLDRLRSYERKSGSEAPRSMPIYAYDSAGVFIGSFGNGVIASKHFKTTPHRIYMAVKERSTIKGVILSRENLGAKIENLSVFKINPLRRTKVQWLNSDYSLIKTFNSLSEAEAEVKCRRKYIGTAAKTGKMLRGFYWRLAN